MPDPAFLQAIDWWWLSALVSALAAIAAVAASAHALLTKRDPRSALGWIAVSAFFPAFGPGLYYVFGINRIRTRAKRLHAPDPVAVKHRPGEGAPPELTVSELRRVEDTVPDTPLDGLLRMSGVVTGRSLTPGNQVTLLCNGEEAFPAMIASIEAARHSVYLTTYIFESDQTGLRFADALARAVERGLRVRVLVDGVGELYSRPRISPLLAARNVPVARFLPPRLWPPQFHINLRTHRKVLIVDREVAYTGGMNLGDRHLANSDDPGRVIDVHFALRGPVVRQFDAVFREDWEFASRESLPEDPGCDRPVGNTWARIVLDGPNEDLDQLATILIGAVSEARQRVWIVTPYFLPPRELVWAMKSAALRGVDVRVILPGLNNLPYVHWASRNGLSELLQWGVRVYYQPAPFAHTKLFVVDQDYAQFGSANLDPRSLRLNFELTVEVLDSAFVAGVAHHIQSLVDASHEEHSEDLEARPLWQRTRDAIAWLFSPYL